MTCIYDDVLRFQPEPHLRDSVQEVTFKYLDGLITLSFNALTVGHYNPNELFILTGSEALRGKRRLQPYAEHSTREHLRRWASDLTARRARWAQIGLQTKDLVYAILLDILELHREGYSSSSVQQLWRMQRRTGPDYVSCCSGSASACRCRRTRRRRVDQLRKRSSADAVTARSGRQADAFRQHQDRERASR